MTTATTTGRRCRQRRPRRQHGSDDMPSSDPATTTVPGQPACVPGASWNWAGRRCRVVPRCADRAAQAAPTCGRTTADGACPSRRAKTAVPDVSSPASLAITPSYQLPDRCRSFPKRTLYHMNVFGGPPVLPRVIGIFLWSSSSVYQAGEVGHRSTEQRFVAVATFKYAHDAALGPLVGKSTDVLCESIEK